MVILVFLHMARTFFFGAYKYPRELNWIIGVVLLILTMTMSFTGYLLPFDQRSYWATIVGVNINGTGPIVGPFLSDFLRGGAEFGSTTLSRFYAIHMLLVPGRDRRHDRRAPVPRRAARHHRAAVAEGREPTKASARSGSSVNQREKEQYLREYSLLKAQGKPFFPYAVAKDSLMACVVLLSIILMSLMFGAELGPEGGPDDDHLRAAAGVVLLLPLRAAARDQAGDPDAAGDDRRADDLHDPADPAAVLRPQPGAPARAPPDRDDRRHLHDRRHGLPHLPRRGGRLAERDRHRRSRRSTRPGKLVVAQSGCLACHKIGENGNDGPGPDLTDIGDKLPKAAILRTLENPTAPMPSFAGLPEEKKTAMVDFLAQLRGE